MEPRMRAGLIGGGGAAVATFFLSLIFVCASGPLIAILGGFNAGMIIGRDLRFTAQARQAGARAGLYAGCVVGAAQILGMIVVGPSLQTQVQQQAVQTGTPYTDQAGTAAIILLTVIVVLLEIGITVACGVWGATWAAKRMGAIPATPQPRTYTSTYMPPPVAPPPPNAAQQMPPPPAVYPPPPSYYGLLDAPSTDTDPPNPPTV